MGIQITAVGGYGEIGKNMTAVKIDDTVIICDMGIHLDHYIAYTEDEDLININSEELIQVGAVPDITAIEDWKDKVKAIVPSHAHLDHIGAVPYLANRFNAPVIGTPFTTEVINAILRDEKIKIGNEIKTVNVNGKYKVNDDVTIEFINVTHSTPQAVMIALHTKYGAILYGVDFKFDKTPTFGQKPNFKRMKELGKQGVLALIIDSTYADHDIKMPSEAVAKQMLKDVMLGVDSSNHIIIATTFSSHISRLMSIIEYGRKLRRKIVFIGRSLSKYAEAAENVGIAKFDDVEIVKYGSQIKRWFKKLKKSERKKYLLVVTGHQGEPKATLSKMSTGLLDFKFEPEDHVIFSCHTIPTETNRHNRRVLEESLRRHGVRIFKDIHVSGHAAREDLRDLFNLIKPTHIIPAHGEPQMLAGMRTLALDMGYGPEKIHMLHNGSRMTLK